MSGTTRILFSGAVFAFAAIAPAQSALQFVNGGNDDHIDYPASVLTVPDRELTVEAWITYDDATLPVGGSRWPTICRHNTGPSMENYWFRVQAGGAGNRVLAFAVRTSTGLHNVSYTFAAGEFLGWTHVAATYDNQNLSLYVNGTLANTSQATGGNLIGTSGTLRVGNGDTSNPGAEVWHGGIDELRIWPIARTEDEIQFTMNDTLFAVPNTAQFAFDGFYDDILNGLTGTVSGTVPFIAGPALGGAGGGSTAFGTSSTTCTRHQLGTTVGSPPMAGNADFSIACYDARVGQTGALFIATAALATPFTFFGVDFFVDPGRLLPVQPPTTPNGGGTARRALPLPMGMPSGLTLHTQFFFIDDCGAEGLVASQGLTMTTQ